MRLVLGLSTGPHAVGVASYATRGDGKLSIARSYRQYIRALEVQYSKVFRRRAYGHSSMARGGAGKIEIPATQLAKERCHW